MKKSSSLAFISAGVLASIVSVVPMTLPAAAQTNSGTGTQGTSTTFTTYEHNKDNSGLWGLTGLVGLVGLLGRRKEEDRTTTRRDDKPVYRDPSIR
jgi:hypothetical protein